MDLDFKPSWFETHEAIEKLLQIKNWTNIITYTLIMKAPSLELNICNIYVQ